MPDIDPLDIQKTLAPDVARGIPASRERGAKAGATHTDALQAGDTLGQYKIIRLLGRGGMGEVYEAEHVHMRKRYALKLLPRAVTSGSTFLDRFRIEARVMADLQHPHIVHVNYMGEDSGKFYLVMDLIEGPDGEPRTLEDVLGRSQHRTRGKAEGHAKRRALQILDALHYAHGRAVVHRDLKPGNILIDADDSVKVADFGLAKVIGGDYLQSMIDRSISLSMAGDMDASLGNMATEGGADSAVSEHSSNRSILGTYEYMAPEQKTGGEITPRTDIYAFGLILYRMLTGKKAEGAWDRPSELGFPPEWDRIILGCLKNAPADRWQSAAELKAELGEIGIAKGAEHASCPPAGGKRTADGRRRPQTGKWAVLLALLAALAAGGWWVWQSRPSVPLPRQDQPGQPGQPNQPDQPNQPGQPGQPGQADRTEPPVGGKLACTLSVEPAGASLTLSRPGRQVKEVPSLPAEGLSLDLEPGTYTVLLNKPGYQPLIQKVTFGADNTKWSAVLAEQLGDLKIESDPGVTVTAISESGDNFDLGTTDRGGKREISTLRVGRYTVTLSRENYTPETKTVEITSSKPAVVKQSLTGLPGSLRVASSRTAEIWKDGRKLGETNQMLNDLAAGKHVIELRCRGFRTERMTVDIPPNEFKPAAAPDLVPESGAIRVEATVPADARDHFAGIDKRLRFGDGEWQTVRTLPHTEDGLACEEHEVSLQVSGYSVKGSGNKITVRDGQIAAAVFTLSPKPGTATIAANAANAEVFAADGTRLGRAGELLSLPSFADHCLTVKARGYKDATSTVRIPHPEADAGTYRVTMEEINMRIPPGFRAAEGTAEEPYTKTGWAKEIIHESTGIELVYVPAGGFTMGSPSSESGRDSDETQHRVTLTKGFYLGKHEVTQGQWEKVMGSNPSNFKNAGGSAPVEQVSWYDCQAFCGRMGDGFRLPTEAEWEYACRAGTTTAIYTGPLTIRGNNNGPELDAIAWYGGNSGVTYEGGYDSSGWPEKQHDHSRAGTHPAGQRKPNAWGLYDMIGNVWEWCQDWFAHYPTGAVTDPAGPRSGTGRVLRGGGWSHYAWYCRSAYRSGLTPDGRSYDLGFRLLMAVP